MTTDSAAARPARSEGSRQRILAAAASIASEVGYEGTTISKVTKRSGLPASSIYWFFKDKEELLAEVVAASHQEWAEQQPLWEPPSRDLPIGNQLRDVLNAAVLSLPTVPEFMRIGLFVGLESRAVEPAARTRFVEIRAESEDLVATWFEAGLQPDVLERAPELARQLAQLIIAATDGLFLAYQIQDVWDPSDFVDALVVIVEAAIAAS